jgi:hypothetical protein
MSLRPFFLLILLAGSGCGGKPEPESDMPPQEKTLLKLGATIKYHVGGPHSGWLVVDLSKVQPTDEVWTVVRELKNLESLHLHEDQITDETLKALRASGLLHRLDVAKDKDGMPASEPADVVTLKLRFAKVTDAGLKELSELKRLQTLDLCSTKVTDEGLKELRELKQLRHLDLEHTPVSDSGMKDIKGLQNLQTLTLSSTGLTDEGLRELRELTKLEELLVGNTKVTEAGAKELREDLPKCKILFVTS